MHHRPAGPPLSARMAGSLTRSRARTRRTTRRRGTRLGLGMALTTAVTGFFLAVPVVSSGSGTSPVSYDSSSSATRFADETSPVVMGRDGAAPASPVAEAPVPPAPEVPAPPVEVPAPEVPAAAPETAPPAPEPPTAPATSFGAPAPGSEAEVLALVNTVRAGAGCAPLLHDEGLATVARGHSADMRDRGFFDHTNPDGRDPFDRAEAAGQTNARAENIAYGQPDPAAVMDAWMNSSGHRANILDCGLRTLGTGVAEGPGGPWWTQLFGD